jgi:hypothetical protein
VETTGRVTEIGEATVPDDGKDIRLYKMKSIIIFRGSPTMPFLPPSVLPDIDVHDRLLTTIHENTY